MPRARALVATPSLQGGAAWIDDVSFAIVDATAAPRTPRVVGSDLQQNVPNPFNPSTKIAFELEHCEHLALSVYDATGRRVITLVDGTLDAGPHALTWNGRTADAAAGIHWYEMRTAADRSARSMVLVK